MNPVWWFCWSNYIFTLIISVLSVLSVVSEPNANDRDGKEVSHTLLWPMTLLTLATCAHNLAMSFDRWLPWLSTYRNDTSWVSSYHFLRYFICWSSRPLLQMVCPSKACFTRRRQVVTRRKAMRAVVTAGTTTTTYRLNTTSSDIGDRRVERATTTN